MRIEIKGKTETTLTLESIRRDCSVAQVIRDLAREHLAKPEPKEKAKPGPKPTPAPKDYTTMTREERQAAKEDYEHRKAISEGTMIFLQGKLDSGMDTEEILQRFPDHYAALLPRHREELFGAD